MAQWYYKRDGVKSGPVTTHQLKDMAVRGELHRDDQIWKEGLPAWATAGHVKGLFDVAPAADDGTAVAIATAPVAAAEHVAAAAPPPPPLRMPPVPSVVSAPLAPVATPSARPLSPVTAAPPIPSHAPPPPPPEPAPAAAVDVGYYSATSGLPARAQQALRVLPPVTGPRDAWPLDDAAIEQVRQAGKLRSRILGLSLWFRLCFFFGGVATAIQVIAAIFAMTLPGRLRNEVMLIALTPAAACLGITALYYFCSAATRNCRIWAPITMLVLHALGSLASIGSAVWLVALRGTDVTAALPALVGVIFPGVVAVICGRVMRDIPKFLAQPAWVQEALLTASF